jgi:TonB family protein
MYEPYKQESSPITIKFPWDSNTARGFVVGLAATAVGIFLMGLFTLQNPKPPRFRQNTVPTELIRISFGDGDGTGLSAGNLTKEGAKKKGTQTPTNLHDATRAAETKYNRNASTEDIDMASNYIPRSELSSGEKNNNAVKGTDRTNYGYSDGDDLGNGLGGQGTGKGKGLGYGDISWGGGGNRIVTNKKLPRYPKGLNVNTTVKLKFTVAPDGRVLTVVPLRKGGDPVLEQAAIRALRQWKFNPLDTDQNMVGIIPFIFTVG